MSETKNKTEKIYFYKVYIYIYIYNIQRRVGNDSM